MKLWIIQYNYDRLTKIVIDRLTWTNKIWLFEYFNTQNPTQISKIKNVQIVAWITIIKTQRHKTPCETNKQIE